MTDNTAIDLAPLAAAEPESREVVEARAALLEHPKSGAEIPMLIASLVLFGLMALPGNGVSGVIVLAAVLAFHEVGHLVAMRLCGYSDLKMFFIPFFGAAATGRRYGAPGWQQALISLAGPVPGIVLGAALGLVALASASEPLGKIAFTLVIINAFNLLPVYPLDGGRLFEQVLFGRRPILLVAFQVFAVGALGWMAIALDIKILLYVAAMVFIGIPGRYRTIARTAELRAVHGSMPSDPQQLDATQLQAIAASARTVLAVSLGRDNPAKYRETVRTVYSQAISRPPRFWPAAGLASLWFVALLVSFLGLGFATLARTRAADAARGAAVRFVQPSNQGMHGAP